MDIGQQFKERQVFYLGFYVEPCQNSDFVSSATIEKMSKYIIDELTVGSFDCPDIKCGFIGENK